MHIVVFIFSVSIVEVEGSLHLLIYLLGFLDVVLLPVHVLEVHQFNYFCRIFQFLGALAMQ